MTGAAWHATSVDASIEATRSRPDGLTEAEAARRLAEVGPNALAVTTPVPGWRILLDQFRSLVVVLLVFAAGVALLVGDVIEAASVAAVLLANAAIGFWVEIRARNAMEGLRRIQVSSTTVLRGGQPQRLDARDVVPGDVVLIEAGEAVPADARILSAQELRVIEAPLTGESVPVSKDARAVEEPDGTTVPLADRTSMLYKGTLATVGSARALVVGTGADTEIGKIVELVRTTEAERTPLEERLDALGRRLVWITLGIAVLVIGVGIGRGVDPWVMVQTGIALAVAAVPEGLPVVATVTLALGMRRMARRQALVRSLPAIESLGSATVVCADKTGTLTGGEMRATVLYVGGRSIDVSPERSVGPALEDDPLALEALRIGVLANRAILVEEGGEFRIEGDPTEGALLLLGAAADLNRAELLQTTPEIGEIPFTSERRMMATAHEGSHGEATLLVKGAPGKVVDACVSSMQPGIYRPLDDAARERLLEQNRVMGSRGLRVLALARKALPPGADIDESLLQGLEFIGFVGMEDPPAAGVRETIHALGAAGIRTVMITGDQTVTALAIGEQLGLGTGRTEVVEGGELRSMGAEALDARLQSASVFSRIEPADKLRIVEAFQRRGEVVAMLGDGVNDAPALKRADIGVAMGGRGTDVAKETASLVLQDDRFETIAVAVGEGRVVFDNIRKFVLYLFSCNLSEVLVILGAGLIGMPMPLLPLQILWLNLVTDVFPALALAVERPEDDVMSRPPRPADAAILSKSFLALVVRYAVVITASTLGAFWLALSGDGATAVDRAITVAFMTLAFAQLLHVFNARAHHQVLFSKRLLQNGWMWGAIALTVGLQLLAVYFAPLSDVLGTARLGTTEWAIVAVGSVVPLFLGQAGKLWRGRSIIHAPSRGGGS